MTDKLEIRELWLVVRRATFLGCEEVAKYGGDEVVAELGDGVTVVNRNTEILARRDVHLLVSGVAPGKRRPRITSGE